MMPMTMPPMTLIRTTSRPAMASPRTNLEAPSIAPKKPDSSSSVFRRRRASFSSIRPAERSASIAICLPGIEFEVKACGHLGDAAGALGDDDEIHDHQDGENDDADDEVAAHDELAERLDDVAGGVGPSCPRDRISRVEARLSAEPQHGGDQQHGRERGEFERRLDEQRRHQDQHRERDRDGEREIEQQ